MACCFADVMHRIEHILTMILQVMGFATTKAPSCDNAPARTSIALLPI
jgi:hypothetical protein